MLATGYGRHKRPTKRRRRGRGRRRRIRRTRWRSRRPRMKGPRGGGEAAAVRSERRAGARGDGGHRGRDSETARDAERAAPRGGSGLAQGLRGRPDPRPAEAGAVPAVRGNRPDDLLAVQGHRGDPLLRVRRRREEVARRAGRRRPQLHRRLPRATASNILCANCKAERDVNCVQEDGFEPTSRSRTWKSCTASRAGKNGLRPTQFPHYSRVSDSSISRKSRSPRPRPAAPGTAARAAA